VISVRLYKPTVYSPVTLSISIRGRPIPYRRYKKNPVARAKKRSREKDIAKYFFYDQDIFS